MKFYLKTEVHDEKEITREQYIRFERSAGLIPKCGDVACNSFSFGGIHGRIQYETEDLAEYDGIRAAQGSGQNGTGDDAPTNNRMNATKAASC